MSIAYSHSLSKTSNHWNFCSVSSASTASVVADEHHQKHTSRLQPRSSSSSFHRSSVHRRQPSASIVSRRNVVRHELGLDCVEEINIPQVSLPPAFRQQQKVVTKRASATAITTTTAAATGNVGVAADAASTSGSFTASDIALAAAAHAMSAAHTSVPAPAAAATTTTSTGFGDFTADFSSSFPATATATTASAGNRKDAFATNDDFFAPTTSTGFDMFEPTTTTTTNTAASTPAKNVDSFFAPTSWDFPATAASTASTANDPFAPTSASTAFATVTTADDPFAPTSNSSNTSSTAPVTKQLNQYDLSLSIKENILSSEKGGQIMKLESSGVIVGRLTSQFGQTVVGSSDNTKQHQEDCDCPFELIVGLDVSEQHAISAANAHHVGEVMEKIHVNPEVKVTLGHSEGEEKSKSQPNEKHYQFTLFSKQFFALSSASSSSSSSHLNGLQLASYKINNDVLRRRMTTSSTSGGSAGSSSPTSLFTVKSKVQVHAQQAVGRAIVRLVFHPLFMKEKAATLHHVRIQVALSAIASKMEENQLGSFEITEMKPSRGQYDADKKFVTWMLPDELFASASTATPVIVDVEVLMKFPKLSSCTPTVLNTFVQELSRYTSPVNVKAVYDEVLISEIGMDASVVLRPIADGTHSKDAMELKKSVKIMKSTHLECRFQ